MQFSVTLVLCVVHFYSNTFCQFFLFPVIQQKLANVKIFLFSRGFGGGRFTSPAA